MKTYKPAAAAILIALVCAVGTWTFSQVGKDVNIQGVEAGRKGKLDEAIKDFDKVIVLRDKEASLVYHNRAYALEIKGRIGEAIKSYEEALYRNPKLVLSGQRLGFLYYKTGDYEKAVARGESVLMLDPGNKAVPIWLPDARLKLAEIRKKEQPKTEPAKEEKRPEGPETKEERQILYATIDAMLRTGLFYGRKYHYNNLYYTTPHGYRVLADDGLIVNTPYTIFVSATPVQFLELRLTVENRFLGGLIPSGLTTQSENLEALFHVKNAILGAGVIFNHYNSSAAFYRKYILWDFKAGLILGFTKNDVEMKLSLYPRALIMDPLTSTGKTMDTGMFKIDWTYKLMPKIKLHGLIHARDYYVYNHSPDIYVAAYFARDFYLYAQPRDLSPLLAYYLTKSDHVADYWGVYDIGIGVTFQNLLERTDDVQLSVTIEWIERFYLRNLMNRNPYTLAPNGQGWFGLDLGNYTKGNPFPGFQAISQVISIRLEEQLIKNLFLYQKVILELADQNSEHHEFNLQIGAGVKI